MKRQRGRGRKPGGGGHQGNRPLESNGPDVKIRGTSAQIYEKYMQYARDAQSGGDRVKYENYLQHAEHYFRVMAATMPRDRLFPQQGEGGVPMSQHGEGGDRQPMGEGASGEIADPLKVMDEGAVGDEDGDYDDGDDGDEGGEPDRVEAQGGGGEQDRGDGGGNPQQGERHGRRRRRGRRRHHDNFNQSGGGANNGAANSENGGGENEARSALDSLARRQGALAGD
jgi:hypothetical protein